MKNVWKKYLQKAQGLGSLLLLVVATLCGGCRGNEGGGVVVPDGELQLFADKTSILADGVECVSFTLMFGSQDVSSEEEVQLAWWLNGVENRGRWGEVSFSTVEAGTYDFKAIYGSNTSTNTVRIVVEPEPATGAERNYTQLFAGFQFTSVYCSGCPSLTQAIKAVQSRGLALVPMAFHRNMSATMIDPMTFTMTTKEDYLYACGSKGDALPYFCVNMVTGKTLTAVYDRTQGAEVEAVMDYVAERYPAECGVAIESVYNPSTRSVEVKAKFTTNRSGYYNYQVVLLEDGIAFDEEVCDNVVRALSSTSRYGHKWADGAVCGKCKEVEGVQTLRLDAGWKVENMRVVVLAIDSNRRIVVNCNVCKLGESVGYVVE